MSGSVVCQWPKKKGNIKICVFVKKKKKSTTGTEAPDNVTQDVKTELFKAQL